MIIVSAAGAVGKSTLAQELSHAVCAPLIDLAATGPVGQHSLVGLFQRAFGLNGLAAMPSLIRSGEFSVVIDAMDEARVIVTEAAFEAFLRDAAELASGGPSVSVVLFGRTQIAETAWFTLEDAGIAATLLSIEPFTTDQAKAYVERRIRSQGGHQASNLERFAAPFSTARDLILTTLHDAVRGGAGGDAAEAAAFVGYAPVLDAIAVLLQSQDNYLDTANELRAALSGSQSAHMDVLRKVVEHILNREQSSKLVKILRPSLESAAEAEGWSDWEQLYTPREQVDRLVARMLGTDSAIVWSGPRRLAGDYETAVATFLPEHPFLKNGREPVNAVFESYLLASVLLHGTSRMASAVAARLAEPRFKPSRLFAEFYFSLAGTPTSVPPEHIGWLYDSLSSAETESRQLVFSVDGPEPGDEQRLENGDIDAEFAWEVADLDGTWSEGMTVNLSIGWKSDSEITFRNQLRRASVVWPGPVSLGCSTSDFVIGPSVSMTCGVLQIRTERVTVAGTELPLARPKPEALDEDVVIQAVRCEARLLSKPTVRGRLTVSWPGAEAFPWNEFRARGLSLSKRDPRLAQAYQRFRRIATTLQSHKKGSLARTRHKIEHERVTRGALGKALLRQLVSDGILELRDGFYHWNPEVAANHVAVTWQQLRAWEASPRLAAYLEAFLRGYPGE